jgi:hypothetical protein
VARVLPGSGGSGAPEACSCAAQKMSNLPNTLHNYAVYPGHSRPQSENGLLAIHVEQKLGHSHFCLEAAYRCGLVGSIDSCKSLVFGFRKLFSNPTSKEWSVGGRPIKQGSQLYWLD